MFINLNVSVVKLKNTLFDAFHSRAAISNDRQQCRGNMEISSRSAVKKIDKIK